MHTTSAIDSHQDAHPRHGAFSLLLRTLVLLLRGRIHGRRHVSHLALDDDGERFVAFRKVVVDPSVEQAQRPGAVFKVRFRFKNLPRWANRLLSLIPIPLIVAQPGFRSKTWLLGQDTGDFIGYYEFDTPEAADAYSASLPIRMMRRRAAPGSLSFEVQKR